MVSAIIPTYNRAQLLQRAVASVLTQTVRDLECIVVDDGSTDNTSDVIRTFRDGRLRYLRLASNQGVSAARNAGIRVASGRYLAFLDSDDEWLANKLECQLNAFAKGPPELAVVGCGRTTYYPRKVKVFIPSVYHVTATDVLAGRPTGMGTPMLLVKRLRYVEDVMFDESLPALVDRDYVLRLLHGGSAIAVPEALVSVRRNHGGSHVATPENAARAYRRLIDKYGDVIAGDPILSSALQFSTARELACVGDVGGVRRHILSALRCRPADPRLYVWLLATYLGAVTLRACRRLVRIKS